MQEVVLEKPGWLKIKLKRGEQFSRIKSILRNNQLVTVCEESHCPNMGVCWQNKGTATLMILGDTCTRSCNFCNVKTGLKGELVDLDEPEKIAKVVKEIGLSYVVITSVDRDDLEDLGAGHFARCIAAIKKVGARVEVLIPDFQGRKELVKRIVDVKPNVFAHNIETVKRLQRKVRDPRASYGQSIDVLRIVKELDKEIFTKSSIMLGIGEKKEEVIDAMRDLREVGVDILTIGQYLQPSKLNLPVYKYVRPEEFKEYKGIGKEMGFSYVAAGPFVRSSYKAGELFKAVK